MTKLIHLDDGTLIEIETQPGEAQQIAATAAERVHETLEKVGPLIVNACRPVVAAWRELNQEMLVEQAEVELGLSFEAEGNVYITKAKAGANLMVRFTLKALPPDAQV